MSEFTGEAGTIYIEKAGDGAHDGFDVWFEDFHILGSGATGLSALKAAELMAMKMQILIK